MKLSRRIYFRAEKVLCQYHWTPARHLRLWQEQRRQYLLIAELFERFFEFPNIRRFKLIEESKVETETRNHARRWIAIHASHVIGQQATKLYGGRDIIS